MAPTALLSVSDKRDLVPLAQGLLAQVRAVTGAAADGDATATHPALRPAPRGAGARTDGAGGRAGHPGQRGRSGCGRRATPRRAAPRRLLCLCRLPARAQSVKAHCCDKTCPMTPSSSSSSSPSSS